MWLGQGERVATHLLHKREAGAGICWDATGDQQLTPGLLEDKTNQVEPEGVKTGNRYSLAKIPRGRHSLFYKWTLQSLGRDQQSLRD